MSANEVPIEDYAIIGDCRSAALVSRSGSIDWLCWPRFESPSVFGALLDTKAGSWSITPRGRFETRRRYDGESAVLLTTFRADDGEIVLADAMPIQTPDEAKKLLSPEHEVVRVVTCTRGSMTLDVVYGKRTPISILLAHATFGLILGLMLPHAS